MAKQAKPARVAKDRGCGKVRYPDSATAKRAMRVIDTAGSKDSSGRIPVRWYDCDDCMGVHLTSMEN